MLYGGIPEWPKGADCKSVGTAFDGSNPSPSTNVISEYILVLAFVFVLIAILLAIK
jgi:hypothetical protein